MNSARLLKIIFVILLLVTVGELAYYVYIQFSSRENFSQEKAISNLRDLPKLILPTTVNSKIVNPTVLQSWATEEMQINLADLNSYFASKNQSKVTLQIVPSIDGATVLNKLKSDDNNFILLDVRERNELLSSNFDDFPNIKQIRLGNLINGQEQEIEKNKEIVVVSYTGVRAFIAANYLISKGYANTKILKGGMLQWISDKLPLKTNRPLETIDDVLKYYTDKEIEKLTSNNQIIILQFGPYSNTTVNFSFMDDKNLNDYLKSLRTDKQYIISCSSNHYCFDATSFWYMTRKNISTIGFTGYKPEPAKLPF